MMDVWVELSGENVPLAAAEAVAAAEALGGSGGDLSAAPPEGLGVVVALPSEEATVALAFRVALAYRCLVRLPCRTEEEARAWFRSEARPGVSAVFRPVGQPTSSPVDPVRTWAGAWKAGDGKIDLRSPDRRFWYARGPGDRYWLGEELSRVDRQERSHRRMPTLPFQRPVSLPPRLGRVAANLARIRPGERIVDPFVGTGALLAEAALLGARVSGGDRDATMVRGAMANFVRLGVVPELLKVVDAGAPFPPPGGGSWDGVLTDPPYGRSSGSRGEPPGQLLPRALSAWASVVRPGGWLSLVAPSGTPEDLGPEWSLVASVPDRVHRSLTREFRTYRQRGSGPS